MSGQDPRVDACITNSADFADFIQPILEHLRSLIHKAFPVVDEDIKWSMPFFSNRGGAW